MRRRCQMEFFNSTYQIFTTAILFIFALSVLELLLFFFGATISSFFEDLDIDVDADLDVDVDMGIDALDGGFDILESSAASGVAVSPTTFFNIGKIPFFIILICFGVSFGLSGIGLHKIAEMMGFTLSNFIAVPLSVGVSSIATWLSTSLISKILPGEETYAIAQSSFAGREATVEAGVGSYDLGVMVSFVDEFQVTHRVLGSVALPGVEVNAGDKVVLLGKNKKMGGFYILPSFSAIAKKQQQEQELQKSVEVVEEKYMSMTKE